MTSSQENCNSVSSCSDGTHADCKLHSMPLTAYDRYTALRNHRIRFEDALDPNAERVTTLRKHDIIFGRGKSMQDYPGNKRMRTIINKYRKQYHEIQRSEKRDLIESVYKEIIQEGARFLTKSPNDENFVVVDIEVAIQKVGNTLRCRKSWKKLTRHETVCVEKASPSSESKTGQDSQHNARMTSTAARALELNKSNQTITRLPPTLPIMMLRHRSQTMSLLRENTMRLMKQLPLRPATPGDVLYLHHCKSSQWYTFQQEVGSQKQP